MLNNEKVRAAKSNDQDVRVVCLDGASVSIEDIAAIAGQTATTFIPEIVFKKLQKTREEFVSIVETGVPIYGVTTGYGELVNVMVDKRYEEALQTNLIRSHCAGTGAVFSPRQARAILACRTNALCRTYSTVRPELTQRMHLYLQENIIPVIPEVGSLGASGDLNPLSHLAITLIGEGYVFDENGKPVPTAEVLKKKNITPLTLKFKEGLALINGTSAMTGVGSLVLADAYNQVRQAEVITSLILEVLNASTCPFIEQGHLARPHKGQTDCAYNMRQLTQDSVLMQQHESIQQDLLKAMHDDKGINTTDIFLQKSYTLRCIPQIIGAVRDTLDYARNVLNVEINSSNDNPLFFDDQVIFHGGNFHGQPIAFAMDYLAIAMTQVGVLSERRSNRLLNKNLSGLQEFLAPKNAGLQCGFEGLQYPATALVAENRTICSPASIQSVPSNGDNQDVVSMGLIAARNANRILQNVISILAVEWLSAAQAVDLKGYANKLNVASKIAYQTIRDQVDTLTDDRYLSDDIAKVEKLLKNSTLINNVLKSGINLR
jgi:histidine ammonia-lyase